MGPSNFPPLPYANMSRTRSLVVKKLSPIELNDKLARGFCFNCDDKFSPGHRCNKLFLIEGVYEEDDDPPEENGPRSNGMKMNMIFQKSPFMQYLLFSPHKP